jgi:glycosyltransferase involved in cell wall biosynthesis
MDDEDLIRLYAGCSVFVYPSSEPRHVHYSPLEAMVVGAPVLYRKDSLIDMIAGEPLPGRCTDTDEMRAKAQALLTGDRALADEVRAAQHIVVAAFALDVARDQWAAALDRDDQ